MKQKNSGKTSKKETEATKTSKDMVKPVHVEDESYKLDSAIRTLAEAEEIKQDKELMNKIKPKLDKKVKSIAGLQELYDRKYNKASHEEEETEEMED